MLENRPPTETSSEFSRAYLEIDALSFDDVTPMLDLFSRAIPHAQLRRSIYLARGADRYLEHLMQHPDFQRHEQLWGIKGNDGRLLAAAHTRDLPGSSHLNNFAVEPDLQGQGLGGRMMTHWEAMGRRKGAGSLSLDVAAENTDARRLYARSGFRESDTTYEFRLQSPVQSLSEDELPLLQGWPQAQAHFEVFGFGRFRLEWNGRSHPVDLIEGYFRVRSSEARLLAALQRMDPERTILLYDHSPVQAGTWAPMGALIRMHKDLA